MLGKIVSWVRGDPILARKLQAMVAEIDAARTWRVSGDARFVQTAGGQALHIGMRFNGTAYTPGGVIHTGLTDTSKPWLKYDLSTGEITEQVGPPSEPWGANEVWRKKSDFSGAVYF